MAKQLTQADVNNAFLNSIAKQGGGGQYIKLNADETYLRLLPSYNPDEDPSPTRIARWHTGFVGGKFFTAVDYGFLLGTTGAAIREAALEKGTITNEDLQLAAKFGDPFTRLAEKHKSLGLEVPNGAWPRTRYILNAISRDNDGQVGMLDMSPTVAKMLGAVLKTFDDLFDVENGRDVLVMGNGKDGKQRRYESVSPQRDASRAVEGDLPALHDLNGMIASKCMRYEEKVDALFEVFGDACAQVNLGPEDFVL